MQTIHIPQFLGFVALIMEVIGAWMMYKYSQKPNSITYLPADENEANEWKEKDLKLISRQRTGFLFLSIGFIVQFINAIVQIYFIELIGAIFHLAD